MNIILIGFMGTGKSSVAPLLAKKLDMEYIEMDDLIEKKAGKKITKIFKDEGENAFREYEIKVARDLRNKKAAVISAGGGVILNKIIMDYLKENGMVIGLFADFETIERRLENNSDRPLFKDTKEAKKLYNFRKPLYKLYADKMIDTDNKSIEEVAEEIAGLITRSKRKDQRSKSN